MLDGESQLIPFESLRYDTEILTLENAMINTARVGDATGLQDAINKYKSLCAHDLRARSFLLHVADNTNAGCTPLHLAAINGHLNCIKIILRENHTLINVPDHTGGLTALFYAIKNHQYDVIAFLLKAKANVNQLTIRGMSPLQVAVRSCTAANFNLMVEKCIKPLIKAGANLHHETTYGTSLFHRIVQNAYLMPLIDLFLESTNDREPLVTGRDGTGRSVYDIALKFKNDNEFLKYMYKWNLIHCIESPNPQIVALLARRLMPTTTNHTSASVQSNSNDMDIAPNSDSNDDLFWLTLLQQFQTMNTESKGMAEDEVRESKPITSPNFGISQKYLDGRLPALPKPMYSTSVKHHYEQSHVLEPISTCKVLSQKELEPTKYELAIPGIHLSFYTFGKAIDQNDKVTFIGAKRKENALFPQAQKTRVVFVFTLDEYQEIKSSLPQHVDVLVIHKLESKTHGIYTKLDAITCRRLAIFIFAHYYNLNKFIMMDDNIRLVQFNEYSNNNVGQNGWDDVFRVISNKMGDLPCVSVKTSSVKEIKAGELGSKLFMIDMSAIKTKMPLIINLFLLFPFAKDSQQWGEDYYFQLMLHEMFKNESAGYHILDENDICLTRSRKHTNAFAKTGAKASYFRLPVNLLAQGFTDEQLVWLRNTYVALNSNIEKNKKQYEKMKEKTANADLTALHASANGTEVQTEGELLFSLAEADDFSTSFKKCLSSLEFVPGFFRPYQARAFEAVCRSDNQHGRILLPTASGKTFIQCQLAQVAFHTANDHEQVVIVTPTIDLVNQFYKDFIEFNALASVANGTTVVPNHLIIKISSDQQSCHLTTLQSNNHISNEKTIYIFCLDSFLKLLHEKPDFLENIPLLLFDEYHDYHKSLQANWKTLRQYSNLILGFTATPPEHDEFRTIFRYTRAEGTHDGFLSPVIADSLGVDFSEENVLSLIECLPKILHTQIHPGFQKTTTLATARGIIYLPSIDHCEEAKSVLTKNGITSYAIHSRNPHHKKELDQFLDNDETPGVLLACRMLRFGYNDKKLSFIIIGQNITLSYEHQVLIEQLIGRIMRKLDDKIGYVLAFDNVVRQSIMPLLTDQKINMPIATDYLAEENTYYKENNEWHAKDGFLSENMPVTFKLNSLKHQSEQTLKRQRPVEKSDHHKRKKLHHGSIGS